jgi:hypothetical protein
MESLVVVIVVAAAVVVDLPFPSHISMILILEVLLQKYR